MSGRRQITGWLLAAMFIVSRVCSAADEGSAATREGDAPVIKYAQVFAPADRIANWPRGGLAYWPVKIEEFERLIGGALAGSVAQSPYVEQAEYTAAVDGDTIRGSARLNIAYRGSLPALLSLEPCELA